MYLLAKFGVHRSYGNGDSSSYINSYMNEYLEKTKLSASIRHIARFSKSGIGYPGTVEPKKFRQL